MFIVPTDNPVVRTCSKCGKMFIMTETRTCTSLNNFISVCMKCQFKDMRKIAKSIFSIFKKDKNN